MNTEKVQPLIGLVCRHGLSLRLEDLSGSEYAHQAKAIKYLLDRGEDPKILASCIKYGMANVWPFSEGRAWDAWDLKKNLLKAKGEYGRSRRMNHIPIDATRIPRPMEGE